MQFFTRKMIMPQHLNGAGTLFGGQALSWIDEEAAVFAACQMGSTRLVTKFMSSIDFQHPARTGDIVEIGVELVKFGTTSITVNCLIRNKTSKETVVSIEKIVFVNVDEQGLPKPHGKGVL